MLHYFEHQAATWRGTPTADPQPTDPAAPVAALPTRRAVGAMAE
jgi:hypothetical protein